VRPALLYTIHRLPDPKCHDGLKETAALEDATRRRGDCTGEQTSVSISGQEDLRSPGIHSASSLSLTDFVDVQEPVDVVRSRRVDSRAKIEHLWVWKVCWRQRYSLRQLQHLLTERAAEQLSTSCKTHSSMGLPNRPSSRRCKTQAVWSGRKFSRRKASGVPWGTGSRETQWPTRSRGKRP
jgi:hypothetical protein